MVVRVEGNDRKSFFAIAESPNGIDNFRFWEYPIRLPDTDPTETNVYDIDVYKRQPCYRTSNRKQCPNGRSTRSPGGG